MAPITLDSLSDHDKMVLDAIFTPTQIGLDATTSFNEELPEDLKDPNEDINDAITESIKFEREAVIAAQEDRYDEALVLFQKAMEAAPLRGSPYNNRAQTLRLINDDAAALRDLNKALELSPTDGRTRCKALCQRGLLRRKEEDSDGAKEDFTKAAKLGSKFAQSQLIEMNPYAALCNKMLREAFDKLK